jgi:ketol-acid reductoisomerase
VNEQTRAEMKKMLEEIRSGAYADQWIKENETGRPWFNEQRSGERNQLLEQVGARLRTMMPFLDAVEVTQEGEVKRAAGPEGVVR